MRPTHLIRLWPILLLTLSGCFLRVNGKPLFGEGGSSENGSNPLSDLSPTINGSADPGVIKLYTQASYRDFLDDALAKHGQNTILPGWVFPAWDTKISALKNGNPDPGRMPGWDNYDLRARAFAVIYAAIERSWTEACYAEFDGYWKGWSDIDATYRPKLEAASEMDFYEGTRTLRELFEAIDERAAKEKLNLPSKHPLRWGGLRYEVLQAYYDKHQGMPAMKRFINGGAYHQKGHPRGTKEQERDAFCAYAAWEGTSTLPAMPSPKKPSEDLLVPQAWRKNRDATQHRLEAAKPGEALAFEGAQGSSISLQHVAPTVGKLVLVGGGDHGGRADYEVSQVSQSGGVTKLTLTYERRLSRKTNCRRTGRIARVRADGYIEYEELCDMVPYVQAWTVNATLRDLPKNMIKRGDVVGLYGKITSAQVDRGHGKARYHNRFSIEGVQLERVERGKTVIY